MVTGALSSMRAGWLYFIDFKLRREKECSATRLFLHAVVPIKSLVEPQKFLEISQLVQMLAHAKFQPDRTTLLLLVTTQLELLRANWSDCTKCKLAEEILYIYYQCVRGGCKMQ